MNKYRALIIDDEHQVRYATARALGRLGFDCQLAADGRNALELLRQTKYDLVVTDLKMPQVNGHKLATALLNLERPPAISVLTGIVEPKLAKDLTARGVERVFFKPVDYAEFASDLLALVEQRGCSGDELGCSSSEANKISRGKSAKDSSSPPVGESETVRLATDLSERLDETVRPHAEQRMSFEEVPDGPKARIAHSSSMPAERHEPKHFGEGSTVAFWTKIEAEVSRTRKALLDLERAVAAGQNVSYFCLAIALGAGLLSGLILGWLSSHLLTPVTAFK